MGERLRAYNNVLANHKPTRRILGGLIAVTLVSGIEVATHQDGGAKASKAETYRVELMSVERAAAEAKLLAKLRHERHEAKVKRVRDSVPISAYTAAMVQAGGNVTRADQVLLAHRLPPIPVDNAEKVARRLHFRFTAQDRVVAAQTAEQWDTATPDNQLEVLKQPQAVAHTLLASLAPSQEATLRQEIVASARQDLGLHEDYDVYDRHAHAMVGCNCGPEVSKFTLGHRESWCGDWYSSIYNENNLPLSGGTTWGRPDWQIGRVLINSKSPNVTSLQSWFQQNGEYFQLSDHLPQPGDAVLEDNPESAHVAMIEKLLPGDQALVIAGNAGDAVRESTIALNTSNIVGFGSYFKH